jgi:ABC-type nitrate/sulfonate/bicarbonate transport system substrate-binding protein
MVAAIERGDIDAFATWEPWPTRALLNVKGTKILQDAEGIYNNINFVYMNRTWIEANRDAAVRFMRALVEANDLIARDREAAVGMVSKFLKLPIELTRELMPKLEYDMDFDRSSHRDDQDLRGAIAPPGQAQGTARLRALRLRRPAAAGPARKRANHGACAEVIGQARRTPSARGEPPAASG